MPWILDPSSDHPETFSTEDFKQFLIGRREPQGKVTVQLTDASEVNDDFLEWLKREPITTDIDVTSLPFANFSPKDIEVLEDYGIDIHLPLNDPDQFLLTSEMRDRLHYTYNGDYSQIRFTSGETTKLKEFLEKKDQKSLGTKLVWGIDKAIETKMRAIIFWHRQAEPKRVLEALPAPNPAEVPAQLTALARREQSTDSVRRNKSKASRIKPMDMQITQVYQHQVEQQAEQSHQQEQAQAVQQQVTQDHAVPVPAPQELAVVRHRLYRQSLDELPPLDEYSLNLTKSKDLSSRFEKARYPSQGVELFLELMEVESAGGKVFVQRLKQDRKRLEILTKIFANPAAHSPEEKIYPFLREWGWLCHAGFKGVEILLEKLEALPEDLRIHFIKNYIQTSENLTEFLTAESLKKLDDLKGLSAVERKWWMSIVAYPEKDYENIYRRDSEGKRVEDSSGNDIVIERRRITREEGGEIGNTVTPFDEAMEGFLHVREEYKSLSRRRELPVRCSIKPVKNIPKAFANFLKRLRDSTRSRYPEQQFELFEEEDIFLDKDLGASGGAYLPFLPSKDATWDAMIEGMSHYREAEHYRWYVEHIYKPFIASQQSDTGVTRFDLFYDIDDEDRKRFVKELREFLGGKNPSLFEKVQELASKNTEWDEQIKFTQAEIALLKKFLAETSKKPLKTEEFGPDEVTVAKLQFLVSAMTDPAFLEAIERGVSFDAEIQAFIDSRYTDDPITQWHLEEHERAFRRPYESDGKTYYKSLGPMTLEQKIDKRNAEILKRVYEVTHGVSYERRNLAEEEARRNVHPSLADVTMLARWFQYLPIRETTILSSILYYEAYQRGEFPDDRTPNEDFLRRAARYLKIPKEELQKQARENRAKIIALGRQHELPDEFFYNRSTGSSSVLGSIEEERANRYDVPTHLDSLLAVYESDAYQAMRHFTTRLQRCTDDRAKFSVFYQQYAAERMVFPGQIPPPADLPKNRIELLARSLFDDEYAWQWSKARIDSEIIFPLNPDHRSPSPPPLNTLDALSRITELNLTNLLNALRKVDGFGRAVIPPIAEFNEFLGSDFFNVAHSAEEIAAQLQARFNFTLKVEASEVPRPAPIVIPHTLAGTALKLVRKLHVIYQDETQKTRLSELIGAPNVEVFLRASDTDGRGALDNLLVLIANVRAIQPDVWETFNALPIGQEMQKALIFPYTVEIAHSLRGLSTAAAPTQISMLTEMFCRFIATGNSNPSAPLELKALTRPLLEACEEHREPVEKLIGLLKQVSADADRTAIIELILRDPTIWFQTNLIEVFATLSTICLGRPPEVGGSRTGEGNRREISGLLERLLENLPPKGDPVPELNRRLLAAKAMTQGFRYTEAEELLDLIVAHKELEETEHDENKKDITHLSEMKGLSEMELLREMEGSLREIKRRKWKAVYEAYYALYRHGRIGLARQVFALNHFEEMGPLLKALNQEMTSVQFIAAKQLLAELYEKRAALDPGILTIMLKAYLIAPKDPEAIPPKDLLQQIQDYLDASTSPEERARKEIALVSLYQRRPMPSAKRLRDALSHPLFEVEAFRVQVERDPDGRREEHLQAYDRAGNLTRARAVLKEIECLQESEKALPVQRQYQLDLDLRYIYAIWLDIPRDHAIHTMTQEEISAGFRSCRADLLDESKTPHQKHLAQLRLLALACEAHYRTTGQLPYSTQILSILMTLIESRDMILQINTGEGKTLTSVLMATLLWASRNPHAVDICSANMALANAGYESYRDFFDYVGVGVALVEATSEAGTYKPDGINFSSVSELSLYRSRVTTLGVEKRPTSASLILDEVDQSVLDDIHTKYRFAVQSTQTQGMHRWIYPIINDFIESDLFLNSDVSPKQDVVDLKVFIRKKLQTQGGREAYSRLEQQRQLEGSKEWEKQLEQWIESALQASTLRYSKDKKEDQTDRMKRKKEVESGKKEGYPEGDYLIELAEKDDRWVLVAHILTGSPKKPNRESTWSHGVHQLLHARLNKELEKIDAGQDCDPQLKEAIEQAFERAGRRKPKRLIQAAFPMEPELHCVHEETNKSVRSFYQCCEEDTSFALFNFSPEEAKTLNGFSEGLSTFLGGRSPSLLEKIQQLKDIGDQYKQTEFTQPETVLLKTFLDEKGQESLSAKLVTTSPRGRIIGLTATSGSEREQRELKEEERLTLYKIPPHQPNQRRDLPIQIEKNEEAQRAALLRTLEARGNQPVLIHCRSAEETGEIEQWLRRQQASGKLRGYPQIKRADPFQTTTEEELLKLAGETGTIMVATLFGRGSDIKPQHPKGLLVVTTHLLPDRQILQVQGRAGRQSQQGETVEIINRENYPSLKGKYRRKTLNEEIAKIRRKAEKSNKARRKYQIRQVDVMVGLLEDQVDRWMQLAEETTSANRQELRRRFEPIKTKLIDELEAGWAHVLAEATRKKTETTEKKEKGKKSSKKSAKKVATTDSYELLENEELETSVREFREKAQQIWEQTKKDLKTAYDQLPKRPQPQRSPEDQRRGEEEVGGAIPYREDKLKKLQGYTVLGPKKSAETAETLSSAESSPNPSPAGTPPPPSTPTSVASSSSSTSSSEVLHSPILAAKNETYLPPHLPFFAARESAASVVVHYEPEKERELGRDALREQFEAILKQAASEKNQAIYARLLGTGRRKDDFIRRFSQILMSAMDKTQAYPEHLETTIQRYYQSVMRLLQAQCDESRDFKSMSPLFALLLLPVVRMASRTQSDALKGQVKEAFLIHVNHMAVTSGADQYTRYLVRQIGDSVKFVGEETIRMRDLTVQLLQQYGTSKMAPDRRVLVEGLIPALVQAQNREGMRSVLDKALIQLLQDDRKHHRDYSKPGRCYQLLVQCKQVLETHDMSDQTRVSLLKANQLRYSMITLLQQYGARKIAVDRKELIEKLISDLVQAQNREGIRSILDDAFIQLLQGDRTHHRDYSKPGRCYQLLVQCKQMLEIHDEVDSEISAKKSAGGSIGADAVERVFEAELEELPAKEKATPPVEIEVLDQTKLRYSTIVLLQRSASTITPDRRALVDELISKLIRFKSASKKLGAMPKTESMDGADEIQELLTQCKQLLEVHSKTAKKQVDAAMRVISFFEEKQRKRHVPEAVQAVPRSCDVACVVG